MTTGMLILAYCILAYAVGPFTSMIAQKKGRSGPARFFIGLFLGLIGLVIALFLKPTEAHIQAKALREGTSERASYALLAQCR